MIRINLLGEKQDKSAIYALQMLIFGVTMFAAVVACFFVHTSESEAVSQLETEKYELDSKLTKLRQQTKKVEELEEKRKLLKEKLNTIAVLKQNKIGPVRLLDGIAAALPEFSWLLKIEEKEGYVMVDGVALDNQTVSLFMYNVGQIKLIADVKLVYSRNITKDSVTLKEFSLSVQTARKAEEIKKAEEVATRQAEEEQKKKNKPAKPAPQAKEPKL